MKKSRSDAVLKKMAEQSPEFGEKLFDWCKEGYKQAREQLAADGIALGGGWLRQLSEFYSWWELRREFQRHDSFAEDVADLLRREFPDAAPEKISALNQLVFTMKAANAGNAKEFREMEYLKLARETALTKGRQKEEELQLKRANFEVKTCEMFLRWFKDKRAQEIASAPISNADKIAQLRQTYFADVDALQASGEVVIPKG